jgi:hypothetical protein
MIGWLMNGMGPAGLGQRVWMLSEFNINPRHRFGRAASLAIAYRSKAAESRPLSGEQDKKSVRKALAFSN